MKGSLVGLKDSMLTGEVDKKTQITTLYNTGWMEGMIRFSVAGIDEEDKKHAMEPMEQGPVMMSMANRV